MTGARQLAAALAEDAWATPAAILVAKIDDPQLEVLRADFAHLRTLERVGCLWQGHVTPLGQRVGMVLRAEHGIQPWPRWMTN